MTGGQKEPINKIYLRTTLLKPPPSPPPHLPPVFLCVFTHESAAQTVISVTILKCFHIFF
jgi:hypothetical protein